MNSAVNDTIATCDCWWLGMVRPTRQFTTLGLRHWPPDTNFVHPFTSVCPSVGRLKSTFPIWFKRIQSIAKIFTSTAAIRGVYTHICQMRDAFQFTDRAVSLRPRHRNFKCCAYLYLQPEILVAEISALIILLNFSCVRKCEYATAVIFDIFYVTHRCAMMLVWR